MSGAATRLIAGVDLGGTKISACIATPEGVIARHRQAVPLDGEPGAIAASMRTLLEHCCADGQREWSEIESVGLSACGPFGRDGDGRGCRDQVRYPIAGRRLHWKPIAKRGSVRSRSSTMRRLH
jgi:predicted NBD/HSP70 family sugar kinase